MSTPDRFATHFGGLSDPITGAFSIAPDDASDITTVTRGIVLGTAGDLAVVFKDGSTITLPGLNAGVIYPIRITRVLATGTTATGIVGLH